MAEVEGDAFMLDAALPLGALPELNGAGRLPEQFGRDHLDVQNNFDAGVGALQWIHIHARYCL